MNGSNKYNSKNFEASDDPSTEHTVCESSAKYFNTASYLANFTPVHSIQATCTWFIYTDIWKVDLLKAFFPCNFS